MYFYKGAKVSQVEITAFFIRNWHLQGVLSEVFSDPVSVSTIYL